MANLSWSPLPQNALGCAYAWNEGDVINQMPLKGPLGIGAIIPGIGRGLPPVEEITERIGGRVEVVRPTGFCADESIRWLNDAVDGEQGHALPALAA